MGPDPYKRRSCLLPYACSSFFLFISLTSALSAGIIIILISYFNFNFPLHLHLHLYLRCRQKARTAGKEAEDWFTEYLNKKDVDPDKRYGTTPPVFSTLTRARPLVTGCRVGSLVTTISGLLGFGSQQSASFMLTPVAPNSDMTSQVTASCTLRTSQIHLCR